MPQYPIVGNATDLKRVCAAGHVGKDNARRVWIRQVRAPAKRRLRKWRIHGLQLWTMVSIRTFQLTS